MNRRRALANSGILGMIFIVGYTIGTGTYLQQQMEANPATAEDASVAPLSRDTTHVRETAVVTQVIDGDTIQLDDGRRVRLIGIDTPEMNGTRGRMQCFGVEAMRRTRELLEGKRIELEKDMSETDNYGRRLRYVVINNVLINELLVREGYARAVSYPPDIKYQERFRSAEHAARRARVGLWRICRETSTESAINPRTH